MCKIIFFFIFYRFLESLKIVRKKHCVAFRRSSEAGLNRVSQLDMALAQFGFMGFTLLGGDYLGVNNNFEELEGLIHFWRVIGSMLGMEDKFVHCISFWQKLFFFFNLYTNYRKLFYKKIILLIWKILI